MKPIRTRLTYANVMSTLAVFMVLTGGAAIAAKQLVPKKSVGTKQLKANAVTTAKLKKNAVTKAKIKKGAVDGTKIADGSVGGSKFDLGTTPFSRIVYEARGSGAVSVPHDNFVQYPLSNPVYTQEPGRDDTYVGAADVAFDPGCAAPRSVVAYLMIDPVVPDEKPSEANVAAAGYLIDQTGGRPSGRLHIGSYLGGVRFQPDAPTNHTLQVWMQADCDNETSGATATFAGIDVIGTK